jgi:hypothetical protein
MAFDHRDARIIERRDKADSPIELKRLDADFFSEDDRAIRIKSPFTAMRRHNGPRSSLLKAHLTPKSSVASNRRPGPVRQLYAVHQAKKFREGRDRGKSRSWQCCLGRNAQRPRQ